MMHCKFAGLVVIALASLVHGIEVKERRNAEIDSHQEPDVSATGFGHSAAQHGGGKYFQYVHVPVKDHYEHGHRRGNEHHFIERHEKAHPHEGEFKTKVRWGDKHGGYGEHYWDYNHAGHHDDGGEESQQNAEYAPYVEESKQAPKYAPVVGLARQKRFNPNNDVEFVSPEAEVHIKSGKSPRHGGNYRYKVEPNTGRIKRHWK